MLAAATSLPENRGGNAVRSSSWPEVAVVVPSGTKSSRPVVPTSLRIWSAFWMPGISTMIRSGSCTTTWGSETPDASTRRRMIVLRTSRSAFVGTFPSAGSTRYSIRRPPCRSRPSLVSSWRASPEELNDGTGSAKKLATMASNPTTTIRIGPVLRIGAG